MFRTFEIDSKVDTNQKNSTELEVLTYFSEKYVGTSSFDLLFEIARYEAKNSTKLEVLTYF